MISSFSLRILILMKFSFDFEACAIRVKYSIEAETSQEHSRTNGTRFGGVYREYLKIDRERLLPSRRTHLKK